MHLLLCTSKRNRAKVGVQCSLQVTAIVTAIRRYTLLESLSIENTVKWMFKGVFSSHVAATTEVVVRTSNALPKHATDSLYSTTIAPSIRMLETCIKLHVWQDQNANSGFKRRSRTSWNLCWVSRQWCFNNSMSSPMLIFKEKGWFRPFMLSQSYW